MLCIVRSKRSGRSRRQDGVARKKVAQRTTRGGEWQRNAWELVSGTNSMRNVYDTARKSGATFVQGLEVALGVAGEDDNALTSYLKSREAGVPHAVALESATRSAGAPRKKAKAATKTDKNRKLGGESGKGVIKPATTAPMTANMKGRAVGLKLAKKAWGALSDQMGAQWRNMTYAEKATMALSVIPSVSGETAVGVVEGIGSRATQGRGGDEARDVIAAWGEKHGVKQAGSVIGIGVKASTQKEGTATAARRGSKGTTGNATATTEKIATRTIREGQEDVIASRVRTAVDEAKSAQEGMSSRLSAKREKPAWSLEKDERGGPPEGAVPKTIKVQVLDTVVPTKNNLGDATVREVYKTIEIQVMTKNGKVYVLPPAGDWKLIDKDEFKRSIRKGYNAADGSPERVGKRTKKPGQAGPAPIAKPLAEKDPTRQQFDVMSVVGGRKNTEFTDAVLMDAYEQVYKQYATVNKAEAERLKNAGKSKEEIGAAMKGRGAPSVSDVAEAIGFDSSIRDQKFTIRRVAKKFKTEKIRARIIRNVAEGKTPPKNRRKIQLEDSGDAQRERFIAAEDKRARRSAVPRAKPAGKTPIISSYTGAKIGKAVIKGEKIPLLESPKVIAKRRKANAELQAAVPTQTVEPSKIREAILAHFPTTEVGKREGRALRKISELHKLGFSKSEIQKRVVEKKIPNVSARVRKVAKGLGLLNIAAMTAQALSHVGDKKRND